MIYGIFIIVKISKDTTSGGKVIWKKLSRSQRKRAIVEKETIFAVGSQTAIFPEKEEVMAEVIIRGEK